MKHVLFKLNQSHRHRNILNIHRRNNTHNTMLKIDSETSAPQCNISFYLFNCQSAKKYLYSSAVRRLGFTEIIFKEFENHRLSSLTTHTKTIRNHNSKQARVVSSKQSTYTLYLYMKTFKK